MKSDIHAYRAQLQAKLDAVDAVIADMGGTATATNSKRIRKPATGKGRRKGKRTVSAAARKRLSEIAKARWKKAKTAGKKAL